MSIRPITQTDLPQLKAVIDSSELFPADLLDEMVADFFANPQTVDMWVTFEVAGKAGAVAYCAPEKMTEGTYNLYLIAVHQNHQGKGLGGKLMDYFEQRIKGMGGRILIVETSGLPEFAKTREFYVKKGYVQEAVIREFFQAGEDKVVYWKKL